jgi:ABC-type uncharacterized transport system involved in gliding motility auxiliary subunit
MRRSRSLPIRVALVLLPLLFVVLAVGSEHWLRGARVDLTQDRLYTLAPGTRRILDGIAAPIRLTLYFSAHASRGLPQLRGYQQRVRETIEEMVRNAHGKLAFRSVDPQPYSDDEDRAIGAGLAAVPVGVSGERVLFGLTADNGTSAEQVIAFFQPEREAFLEYDLAKLIHDLEVPEKPLIGILSGLPMEDTRDLVAGEAARPWAILAELRRQFRVHELAATGLKHVDPSLRVLVLVAPGALDDDALYAIDQYVLAGGHLLVFVDPDPEQLPGAATDAQAEHNPLARLFQAWGVTYDPTQVVLDRARALAISSSVGSTPVRHPAVLGLTPAEIDPRDVVTANLHSIDVSSTGSFDLADSSTATLQPLLQSSADAMRVPAQRVRALGDPSALYRGYHADGTHYVIAARLHGTLHSAFPQLAADAGHLAQSKQPPEVVLVADTDLLSDRLWVQVTRFFGQEIFDPFANNGDFVLNLIDNLSGSSALISIRGRSSVQRPFDRVLALQREADVRYRTRQQQLQGELATVEHRLAAMPGTHDGAAQTTPDADSKAEQEALLKRKLALRDELRDVQQQLDSGVDALGQRLALIDVLAVPSVLAVLALVFFLRRRRHYGPVGP